MNIENEIFTQEEMELMATYEELYDVPHEKQVTHWWGDIHLYKEFVKSYMQYAE